MLASNCGVCESRLFSASLGRLRFGGSARTSDRQHRARDESLDNFIALIPRHAANLNDAEAGSRSTKPGRDYFNFDP
jgi:hypothetical protein